MRKFIGLRRWLETPPGQYLLEWEQRETDEAVADLFGFHAVQLGVPALDALRANRMPNRWLVDDGRDAPDPSNPEEEGARGAQWGKVVLQCDFDALPFPSNSIDLLVMPHTLEQARDPHLTLREAERVLMPEGRLVIVGFNPRSLWGLRQRAGRFRPWSVPADPGRSFVPHDGENLAYRRLRDWLRLLGFEVEGGRFGCYRPPLMTEKWLSRWSWAESMGDRWWPVFGAVYMVVAVKRVRGMRLVGLARKEKPRTARAPAVATHRHKDRYSSVSRNEEGYES